MMELLGVYTLGVVVGSLLSWFIMSKRLQHSQSTVDLAHECVSQAVFMRATSDVVSDRTARKIKDRANELVGEYDLPRSVTFEYDRKG